jgi:hypothetical protein
MKKIVYASLAAVCFMLCSLCSTVSAQDTLTTKLVKKEFGIYSAGLSASWYMPGMSYWNKTYFPAYNWQNDFNGGMNYGAFLELNLVKNLRARLTGSYWNKTVKSGNIMMGMVTSNNTLRNSLTNISVDVLYNLSFLSFATLRPYVGIGGGFVFVNTKYTQSPTGFPMGEVTVHGQDYTGNVTAGIEVPVVAGFTAAVEFKYFIGNYLQEVRDLSENITNEKVSLSGPQIGINLFWVFPQKYERMVIPAGN